MKTLIITIAALILAGCAGRTYPERFVKSTAVGTGLGCAAGAVAGAFIGGAHGVAVGTGVGCAAGAVTGIAASR